MTENKKNQKSGLLWGFLTLAILLVVVVAFFLLNKKSTYTEGNLEEEKSVAIFCSAQKIEGAFFDSEEAEAIKHEIKAIFLNDKLSKISYSFWGDYDSDNLAVSEETRLHSKYNIYMGENGLQIEEFTPSYAIMGDKLQITLYTDKIEKITNTTGRFFFVGENMVDDFANKSISEMKKFYEGEGFVCSNT